MKANRGVFILLFSGLFLLLTCITMARSLAEQNVISNGVIGTGKVIVTLKRAIDIQGADGLHAKDIGKLSKLLKMPEITYHAQPFTEKTVVEANNALYTVKLTGTNYLLPHFAAMRFKHGCFFTQNEEAEAENVIAVEDEFAWSVFRSEDVVGKNIKIAGQSFRITGVIRKDTSIIGRLLEDGLPEVYIPGKKLEELDETARIDSFQVRTADTDTLDRHRVLIADVLAKAGKNPEHYRINDFNIRQALLDQKADLIVFIPGSISILILFFYLKSSTTQVIKVIQAKCRSDYLSNVLKDNLRTVLPAGMKMITALLGISFIALGIRFTFYIPPELIPEELIDISYYISLIKSNIQAEMSGAGYAASYPELYTRRIDLLTGWLLFVTSAAGLALIYAGLGRMKRLEMDLFKMTLAAGLFFILTFIILAAAAKMTELPFVPDTKSFLVIWAFTYINTTYFLMRKENT